MLLNVFFLFARQSYEMRCEICNKDGFKNQQGLNIHIGLKHKPKPSDEGHHQRVARDRREHPGHNVSVYDLEKKHS